MQGGRSPNPATSSWATMSTGREERGVGEMGDIIVLGFVAFLFLIVSWKVK